MHLVKTAIDFKISASSRDYILLGSWCHKGSKNISKDLKQYKLVPYHWDDRKKFTDDYFYLSNLYEEKLTQFTDALNKRHNLNKAANTGASSLDPGCDFVWMLSLIDMNVLKQQRILKR